MATDITFQSRGGVKEYAEIQVSEPTIVEIERGTFSFLTVYANIQGMNPVVIYNAPHAKDLIFTVDVPQGISVTIESGCHVTSAKMQ